MSNRYVHPLGTIDWYARFDRFDNEVSVIRIGAKPPVSYNMVHQSKPAAPAQRAVIYGGRGKFVRFRSYVPPNGLGESYVELAGYRVTWLEGHLVRVEQPPAGPDIEAALRATDEIHSAVILTVMAALGETSPLWSHRNEQGDRPAGEAVWMFELASRNARMAAAFLAWAQRTPADEFKGVHLDGTHLMSQWDLARDAGMVLRIHCFHRSDPDVPHNHPWAWRSLILAGGYIDFGADGTRLERKPGDLVIDDGSRFHRVELIDGPAWTLFLHGPKIRNDWGFLGADGATVPRNEFISIAEQQDAAEGWL